MAIRKVSPMSSAVLLDRRDGIAVITLNRPERANVLDLELSAALIAAIEAVAEDATVRALLLRAEGRHFCGGGDIDDFVRSRDNIGTLLDTHIPPLHRAIERLAGLPIPVVSALNGPIGGGGIGLALCADIVLAAESMKLRGGYSAIGLTPDVGASWFLARRVGVARTKEIFFTNEPLSAQRCLDWGIVSAVWPDAELGARAAALVESLARGATGALGRSKRLVDTAPLHSLAEHLDHEHLAMVASGRTADAVEGVTAFAGKRAPVFGREPS
jgi:2-(1,2-epoxy-1,2-dihydrophenyl)acetyl-CoA isomerase